MTNLYARQCEIEFNCVLLGEQRYESARAEGGESATPPGQWQTRLALPVLAGAIERFMEAARDSAGRRHTAFNYLIHVEPTQAAYLTIRYVLDAASAGKSFTAIALEVGTAIEDHINVLRLSNDAPGLFRKMMEQLKTSTSARHRTAVWRHVFNKAEKRGRPLTVERLTWSKEDKLAVGTALIELMENSLTLVVSVNERKGRKFTRKKLHLTEEALAVLKEAHEKAAAFAPVHLPMVYPPRDWKTPFRGGYLTGALRGAKMILSHSKSYLDEAKNVDMPAVYDAINIVQATPWRINRPLLAVMKEAHTLGVRYQELFVEADEELPPRPVGIPDDVAMEELPLDQQESLIAWRRDAADVHEANARRKSKRAAMGKKLWVADEFVDFERIYFPHYLDFRGRMYPFASYLNPQADDTGRALLEFADGKPLGERGLYWLKVHIANLFGVDKVSFEERVAWVDKNLETLLGIAMSPIDRVDAWCVAESPWMALAACMELAGALIEGADTYVSHIPIAMDGSCSGLQHYSAMLRDPVGGAAVNLVPAEKPGDIYTEVARRAQTFVDGCTDAEASPWQGGKVVRKIAKQPTMTLCYSATVYGMQGQIKRAIDALGGDSYLNEGTARAAAKYLAPVIWNAIGDTVVAARDAMGFLKQLASVAASEDLPIRWTAPSGFPVVQEYREPKAQIVKVIYAGSRIELHINREGTKLDKRRQISGVAPNFVHSLDASHLMATVNLGAHNGLVDWAVVHDSFGVHAADVDTLHAVLRETFIEQYTPDVLARLRSEVAAQLPSDAELPSLPVPGALDLDAVRASAYFFA
jgi:DNA-directed RNA polymerase